MPKHGDPVEYEVGGRTVRVTSPDKLYFPQRGITKRQVVEHYITVGGPLLRAIGERPTTLKRYVDGVEGDWFYAKRVPKGAPSWVSTAEITFPSGRKADEVCPAEPAVFAWAANLGTFDFHPWPVRRADPDRPDELRIDLDPQPGTTSPTPSPSPRCCARSSTKRGWSAGRRRPEVAASTWRCGSGRSGRSSTSGTR